MIGSDSTAGRRANRHRRFEPGRGRAAAIPLLLALAGALSALGLAAAPTASPSPAQGVSPSPASSAALGAAPPVLAYYYMWFNSASWTHAKTDLPSLGSYDSTNPAVIHQQVTWAREAGVDAFIVSWKGTPSLDVALSELVAECHSQGLKLVLIYEGLDVNRKPIPIATVSSDLSWFVANYGSDPAFDLFGKPAIVWSGSWAFTTSDIAAVRAQIGAPDKVLLLGSERSAAAYTARAGLFDGDAYYWSSGDPLTTPGYQKRLDQLSTAVHAGGGLWLAPASVGYDARLNGGTTVVDRRNGATLTAAWADALASGPDAMALISWNEYTENSYVEPSRNYGARYLDVLSLLTGTSGSFATASPSLAAPSATPAPTAPPTPVPTARGGTAGSPAGPASGHTSAPYDWTASILVAALVLVGLGGLAFSVRSRSRSGGSDGRPTGTPGRPESLGRSIE